MNRQRQIERGWQRERERLDTGHHLENERQKQKKTEKERKRGMRLERKNERKNERETKIKEIEIDSHR